MMENIFRCGYKKIWITNVEVYNDFIYIDWQHSKENKDLIYSTFCHISKIDLQKSLGHKAGDLFEVNGVQVNINAYTKIIALLSTPKIK